MFTCYPTIWQYNNKLWEILWGFMGKCFHFLQALCYRTDKINSASHHLFSSFKAISTMLLSRSPLLTSTCRKCLLVPGPLSKTITNHLDRSLFPKVDSYSLHNHPPCLWTCTPPLFSDPFTAIPQESIQTKDAYWCISLHCYTLDEEWLLQQDSQTQLRGHMETGQ